jgi:hypothetical protein
LCRQVCLLYRNNTMQYKFSSDVETV